jgi:LysM repeat protein
MMECGGHYVYYEKNLEMQNYMIATRKRSGFTPSEIIEDRAIKNFRNLVREKTEQSERRAHSRMVYAMSTFLVLVVLVIGITMINNYDKMKSVQSSLDKLAENVSKEEKEEKEESVETLGDVITPEQEDEEELQTPTTEEEIPQENIPETELPDIESTKTYIVQKGDTLETISKQEYGDIVHIEAICELNQLEDGNLIFIGQKLLLP